MLTRKKTEINASKLRSLLASILIILLIPSALLIYHTFNQLKIEAYYQERSHAEALVQRINGKYLDILKKEADRPFSDYSFTSKINDPATNYVQRSPLSDFSENTGIPGILGYFQIDAKGRLSTPLLPQSPVKPYTHGIKGENLKKRIDIENKIFKLLERSSLQNTEILPPQPGRFYAEETTSLERKPHKIDAKELFDKKDEDKNASIENLNIENKTKNTGLYKDKQYKFKQNPNYSLSQRYYTGLSLKNINDNYFTLFRRAWDGNSLVIQGILLNKKAFLKNVINSIFITSGLADNGDLTVAYQGDVIDVYSELNDKETPTEKKSLLYKTNLKQPLEKVELIFSTNKQNKATGSGVVMISSFFLIATLFGGFVLLYRLGLSQIDLAKRQKDFVSSVSHELKTPLTSIKIYSEMLKEGWLPENKKNSYYKKIHSETERLTRLINNFLQLSNIAKGNEHTDLDVHLAKDLLEKATEKVKDFCTTSGFDLQIRDSKLASQAKILANEDYLMQIIINLIDNAIKFSRKSIKKSIILSAWSTNNAVVFSVRDFGPGIPEDHMKKIFDLFYRAEDEITRETKGTGIGLALVLQLSCALNATVYAKNHTTGVEFQIVFNLTNYDNY